MKRLVFFLGLFWLHLTIPVVAEGRLDKFESGFDRSSKSSSNASSSGSSSSFYSDDDSDWEDGFFEWFMEGLVEGGRISFLDAEVRDDGDPVLPLFRLDVGYQWVDADVGAWVTGGEVGYGPFAVEGRWTGFREERDSDTRTLDFSQLHALYRMGDHPGFELGFGFGAAWLRGEESRSSFSFTLPLRFWLKERWGMEFRPAWTEFNDVGVSDFEWTCLYNRKHFNAHVGYRWILSEADVQDLSGFRVGLGYRF